MVGLLTVSWLDMMIIISVPACLVSNLQLAIQSAEPGSCCQLRKWPPFQENVKQYLGLSGSDPPLETM